MMPSSLDIPGFKVEKLIAEGGMASVYLARQESLARPVALKLLRKFDNPLQASRFFNEGRIIASLEHRNIITIFDLGVVGERHYLAMEYLQGGDLRSRMNDGMTPLDTLELVETLGLCLHFVHQKGIIHRDIKPENILFRQDGSVVLTDFGVAKQLEFSNTLTMDGTTLGSPYYLSPEQAKCKDLDGRADIYSLGIICFEMLTGMKPFQGDSPLETIIAHLTSEIPALPPALRFCQPLLARMTAPNPEDRFASAKEMAAFAREMRTSLPKRKLLISAAPRNGVDKSAESMKEALTQTLEQQIDAAERLQAPSPKQLPRKLAAGCGLLVVSVLAVLFLRQPASPMRLAAQSQDMPGQSESSRRYTSATEMAQQQPVSVASPPTREPPVATSPSLRVSDVNTAIRQAAAILNEKRLTLPKLKQAYELYQFALKKNPRHQQAMRGVNRIAHKFIAIKGDIERSLILANAALKNGQPDARKESQAAVYYRQILELEPGQPEALQGLEKLAGFYADRVEAHLRQADAVEAERNLRLGLALQSDHPRLLALADSLKIDVEAEKSALRTP